MPRLPEALHSALKILSPRGGDPLSASRASPAFTPYRQPVGAASDAKIAATSKCRRKGEARKDRKGSVAIATRKPDLSALAKEIHSRPLRWQRLAVKGAQTPAPAVGQHRYQEQGPLKMF